MDQEEEKLLCPNRKKMSIHRNHFNLKSYIKSENSVLHIVQEVHLCLGIRDKPNSFRESPERGIDTRARSSKEVK